MAGGFFEGFKKIYTGKNIFPKHLFLFLLSLLVSLPCAIAALANNSGSQADIYRYIYLEYPLLGIICTIISLIIGLYMIHFMHNSIKYLIWKDTQSDEEKINALDIMPDINLKLFNHFWKWIGFCIIWIIYMIVFILLVVSSCFIPGFKIGGIILTFFAIFTIYLTVPFIFTSFAKNYSIKENISPLLMFTYLPKIFTSAIVLYLKFIGISILYCIVSSIITFTIFFIIGLIAGLSGYGLHSASNITENVCLITLITSIMLYFSLIIGLAFYYAVANIYHQKINTAPENN